MFIVLRPYVRKRGTGRRFIFFALFGEPIDTEEFCARKGRGPFGDEDMVFVVKSGDVGNTVAEGGDSGADFGGESCRGEDG